MVQALFSLKLYGILSQIYGKKQFKIFCYRLKEYMASKYPNLLEDQDFVDQFLHFMDLVVNNYEASNSWNDVTTHSKYMDLEGDLHMSWHKNGYKTLFEILLVSAFKLFTPSLFLCRTETD